jgi:hypothetical protein
VFPFGWGGSVFAVEQRVQFRPKLIEFCAMKSDSPTIASISGKPYLGSLDFFPKLVDLPISRGV